MTKGELIEYLRPFMDDIQIKVVVYHKGNDIPVIHPIISADYSIRRGNGQIQLNLLQEE